MSTDPRDITIVPRRRSLGGGWDWVRLATPSEGLPSVITPAVAGVDVAAWAETVRPDLQALLLRSGAILFRGFDVRSIEQFESFIAATAGGPMVDYSYRSTPRTRVHDRIYTSTEYPASEEIPLHNEMSYARRWPLKIWFFCDHPSERGGETTIADSRRVFARIPPEVRARFLEKQVEYVRAHGRGLDLPLEEVFGASTRDAIEARCRAEQLDFEWMAGGVLRTRQVCQAAATHPATGERVWFNQAHLFHPSSLGAEARSAMLGTMSEEELPRNARYGDGTPIEDHALDAVRAAYRQEAVPVCWEKGDVLLLDNMLSAHGRRPFAGARRILVGMAEPVRAETVANDGN